MAATLMRGSNLNLVAVAIKNDKRKTERFFLRRFAPRGVDRHLVRQLSDEELENRHFENLADAIYTYQRGHNPVTIELHPF
jgi:hypothetical protein